MPDEIVRYKVEIDPSSVDEALKSVGERLNNVLTSTAVYGNKQVADIQNTFDVSSSAFNRMQAEVGNTFRDVQNGSLFNALGLTGYDQQMPMFKSDFRELNAQAFSNKAAETIMDYGIPAAAIAALAIPGVGPFVSAGIAVGDMAGSYFGGKIAEERAFSQGLQGLSGGAINGQIADALTAQVSNAVNSYGGRAMGMSMDEIGQNLLSFAGAGGLSSANSPAEFESRMQGVIDNARTIAKTLGMFQDQAMQLMGELQSKGIADMSGGTAFITNMQSLATIAGTSPTGLISAGLQGYNMMQGTGIPGVAGFDMSVDNQITSHLMASDPRFSRVISDMGGADAAGFRIMGGEVSFGLGPYGKLMTGAIMGGGDLFGSMDNNAVAYANSIAQNPLNYYTQIGTQGQMLQAIGPEGLAIGAVSRALEELNVQYPQDRYKPETIAGYMSSNPLYNMDYNQAMGAIGALMTDSRRDVGGSSIEGGIYNNLSRSYEPNIGDVLMAQVNQFGKNVVEGFTDMLGIDNGWEKMGKVFGNAYVAASTWISDGITETIDAVTGTVRDKGPKISAGMGRSITDKTSEYNKFKEKVLVSSEVNSGNKFEIGMAEAFYKVDMSSEGYIAAEKIVEEKMKTVTLDPKMAQEQFFENASEKIYGKKFSELDDTQKLALSRTLATDPRYSDVATIGKPGQHDSEGDRVIAFKEALQKEMGSTDPKLGKTHIQAFTDSAWDSEKEISKNFSAEGKKKLETFTDQLVSEQIEALKDNNASPIKSIEDQISVLTKQRNNIRDTRSEEYQLTNAKIKILKSQLTAKDGDGTLLIDKVKALDASQVEADLFKPGGILESLQGQLSEQGIEGELEKNIIEDEKARVIGGRVNGNKTTFNTIDHSLDTEFTQALKTQYNSLSDKNGGNNRVAQFNMQRDIAISKIDISDPAQRAALAKNASTDMIDFLGNPQRQQIHFLQQIANNTHLLTQKK